MTQNSSNKQHSALPMVYLIGAGPGDPELLTLKAFRLLQRADIVLYDALVSPEILALITPKAETIAVGKRCGKHSMTQAEINQLLCDSAHTHQIVVRLKGGDPFIFGRGGEEMLALQQAGIAWQVVPGITAASGAAASLGLPLTHRDHAQSVTYVTGHGQLNGQTFDWSAFKNPKQTLVVYMGIHNATAIMNGLLAVGRTKETPVAIISKATTAEQQVLTTTLAKLGALVSAEQVIMPAIMVIGEVVDLYQMPLAEEIFVSHASE